MAAYTKDPLVLPAGDLRHVITFLSRAVSTDAAGGVVNWVPIPNGTTRAKIEPIKGMELLLGGQDVTQQILLVSIRYQAGIVATMRLLTDSGNQYIVQSIENVLERNRVLKLMCLYIGANE